MRNKYRHIRLRPRTLALVFVGTVVALSFGCAFFNLFYNARKIYNEAEEIPRQPDGTVNRQVLNRYDEVIKKCQMLIANYPKSKWVDDAVLLMGKAFYNRGEYSDAITKFDELETNFPESALNEEGQLYLGKSYVDKGDTERGVAVLKRLIEAKPDMKLAEEVLFLLGTSSVEIDREEDAVLYLEQLARKHPNSKYGVDADLRIAELYLERKEYDKALTAYKKLSPRTLDQPLRIRYLMKLSEVYVGLQNYRGAIETLRRAGTLSLDDQTEARRLLIEGAAFTGVDSLRPALDRYRSVTARYPRSIFSAEAAFHMGVIYQERLDSLNLAKENFDLVPRQYTNSEFATEAISRSVSITKLSRLRASLESGDEEGRAAAQFDLAEVQLFQFNNSQKALEGYNIVLSEFPQSDVAPMAAYAIAYIYHELLEDESSARNAYERLVRDYPESQQAEFARRYLEGERPSLENE